MKKEYLVIQGEEFTIEWYYTRNGKSPAKEYFDSLDRERQIDAFTLFKTMANLGQIRNIQKFRHEGDKIYAFKPRPDRFLCFFFSGKKIIITNSFEKKQDKLPLNEKKKAQSYQEDYESRLKKGEYYD
jgi:Phage derived protein Gp49-like (DUF891)